MSQSETLVAKRTFIAIVDGKRVRIFKDKTRVRADHPLVEGREHLFKPAESQFEDVEQATARPGERRGSRARKRAAKRQQPEGPETETEETAPETESSETEEGTQEPETGDGDESGDTSGEG